MNAHRFWIHLIVWFLGGGTLRQRPLAKKTPRLLFSLTSRLGFYRLLWQVLCMDRWFARASMHKPADARHIVYRLSLRSRVRGCSLPGRAQRRRGGMPTLRRHNSGTPDPLRPDEANCAPQGAGIGQRRRGARPENPSRPVCQQWV
jgi:hypothetical protein